MNKNVSDIEKIIKEKKLSHDEKRMLHRVICSMIKERVYYQLIVRNGDKVTYHDHDDDYNAVVRELVSYMERVVGVTAPPGPPSEKKLRNILKEHGVTFEIEKTVINFDN